MARRPVGTGAIRPEYMTENADGSLTVELIKGFDQDGTRVKALRMREPTVEDQLAATEAGGSDAIKEVRLIANLCEVAPEAIRALTIRDYYRVQGAYSAFT